MTFSATRRIVAALVGLALVGTFASGAVRATTPTPDSHAAHHTDGTPTTTDSCAAPAVATPTMGGGVSGMQMNQEFDLMFIGMMIPHHRSAIAMARVALERAEHEEIRTLAQDIVTTQSAEIDQMTAWRNAWYPGAPAMSMEQMGQMMMGMMQGMSGMMGTPGAGMGNMGDESGMMATMDAASMVRSLCSAAGPFDQAFLQLMIPRHQIAVMMAQVALQRATHPELKQLAQAIIGAQQREIGEMQGWTAAWYGTTPAA